MSNFELTQLSSAAERLLRGKLKLKILAMNGFVVLENKYAEEDANVSRQLQVAVHSSVRMCENCHRN